MVLIVEVEKWRRIPERKFSMSAACAVEAGKMVDSDSMSKNARRSGSKKHRRIKSVHVDRLAEKLIARILAPDARTELESAAIEASTTTEDLTGTEWEDVERAAEQEAPETPPEALEPSPERIDN